MGVSVEEFQRLKKRVDKLRADVSRAEGALEQLLARLTTDFDCEDLESAELLLEELELKAKREEESYNRALQEFNEKWGDKL